MDAVLQALGALVVLTVLLDVFFTVLFPASGRGPIRKPLARCVWGLFRLVGTRMVGQRRRDLLSYSGPVLIAVTLAVWFLLAATGWAMIYKPALGGAIRADPERTESAWATALYFSAYNLTTLGVGDVVARTASYRLLSAFESAVGIGSVSMVITYFLSVYSSLMSRNAFAQGLHHLTGRTDDAAELIARMPEGAELIGIRQHLSSKAQSLREIYQTHRFYPVLRYFHYREPYYAVPHILFVVLDGAALLRSTLDRERYADLLSCAALEELCEAGMSLARGLVPDAPERPASPKDAAQWRERYRLALVRLRQAGLRVRADAQAGADEYVALRAVWDPPIRALADAMLYEWEAIAQPQGQPSDEILELDTLQG